MALTAGSLRQELAPKVDGEKTILLKMTPGQRPEVIFTGMWTGKYIAAATNSIAKAYRVARRNITSPRVSIVDNQITPQKVERKGEV